MSAARPRTEPLQSPGQQCARRSACQPNNTYPSGIDMDIDNRRDRSVTAAYHDRVSFTDTDVAADLAAAGLLFLEHVSDEVALPLPGGRGPASLSREHGRFDATPDEIVDLADPDLAAKLNAGWWRMATEYGLFNQRREFLLHVNYQDYLTEQNQEPEFIWIRVRLADKWDLGGGGAERLRSTFASLFTQRYVPEFTMASLDGRMVLNTTVWGDGTISTLVIRPDRADTPIHDS